MSASAERALSPELEAALETVRARIPKDANAQHPLTVALATIRESLERGARVAQYAQHRSTCILNISQSPLREASWCDCGLTEALATTAERPKEPNPDAVKAAQKGR